MRRSVSELRDFYAGPLGEVVRRMVARRVAEAWRGARGCDVLGLGYATPWLDELGEARRTVAAMPQAQGVEDWPTAGRNRALLVTDSRLPFAAASFDRVLLVHALEEADDARALLGEVGRVLAPSGRLVVVAAARAGLWSRAERTPFGHGRPYTRSQLEALVRAAELEPAAWSQAVYLPPWSRLVPFADSFEQAGATLLPGVAGLILLEAVKRVPAVVAPGAVVAAERRRRARLAVQPAGRIPLHRRPPWR